MEWLIGFIVVLFAALAIYGWFSDKSRKLKEDEYNRNLRQQLHDQKQKFETEVAERTRQFEKRTEFVGGLRKELMAGYVRGRKWLAAFIAEADRVLDDSISSNLKYKKRPAYKASTEVSIARAERRAFKERVKFLEYQLQSYKEYFPFLDEYEEIILDEAVSLSSTANSIVLSR